MNQKSGQKCHNAPTLPVRRKLLSIERLSVNYGDNEALNGVDLDIYTDDFLGVIGPNGGGKTTLVKAILGAVDYSGRIEYDDALYSGAGMESPHRNGGGTRSRLKIGYLPQISNIDPEFPISVSEVILSGLQSEKRRLWSGYTKNDKIKAEELMHLAGIEAIAQRPVGEISGGQMQRTLLCRALISDPRLLILDEPANFVDNKFEKELYELLQTLNSRMAIVMVSHDLGTITSVVKSIVCVNRHVHRHDSNVITAEQLENYECPIQLVSHGRVPHTVLKEH